MDVSSAGERLHRNLRQSHKTHSALAVSLLLAVLGCASPGPPRAPSLGLPEPVRDITATRIGNTVELNFTAPSRSTDKLPLHGGTVTGQICRQLEHQPCVPTPGSRQAVSVSAANAHLHNPIRWTDTLPSDLTQGPPRLIAYRIEFFSRTNRSAGLSSPAFTAAGTPPSPVEDLQAKGSRLGIVLSWGRSKTAGNVVLQRENLAPAARKASARTAGLEKKQPPSVEWLGTNSAGDLAAFNSTLDTTALPDTPYRYIAERRIALQLGTHPIELRSMPSSPVTVTLSEVYPPPTPSGVAAVGYFANGASSPFAVDIIWQPVDAAGLIAPLAGYNLYREQTGVQTAGRERLNTAPVPSPGFHDTTAKPATRYRYSVTAVDTKGNESPAATAILEPSAAQ